MRRISPTKKGFTLIELVVIMPLVILLIGAMVGVIVFLTGSALRSQARVQLQLDVLSALDRIEQDVKLSVRLKNSSQKQINLDNFATDKNPLDSSRRLIKKDCTVTTGGITFDEATTYWTAYWVSSGALRRNTNLNNGCKSTIVWQKNVSEVLIDNTTDLAMEVTTFSDDALGVNLTAKRRVAGQDLEYTGVLYVKSLNISS